MNNLSALSNSGVGELKVLVTDGANAHQPEKLALMAAELLTKGLPPVFAYSILKILSPYFKWYRDTRDSTLVDKAIVALRQAHDTDKWRLQFADPNRIATIRRILAHTLSMLDKE